MTYNETKLPQQGMLAKEAGKCFPLEVCESYHGFYIGTLNEGLPFTRESREYWKKHEHAALALQQGKWTQKPTL